MASAAATYGMTGKATFNILDIADLGLKAEGKDGTMQAVHTGLLELTVGDGEDPSLLKKHSRQRVSASGETR